jgi:2-dehydro-3-deoxygluconokinase
MSTQPRITCFGELLIRLASPDGELLLQAPQLHAYFGGAEANVAVALARFGVAASMVSIVPPNPLGAAAVGELRRHGVDTSGIVTLPGRMGLYFTTTGAVTRPGSVVYDRAGSAFAVATADAIDWRNVLPGSSWLHVSGIASALGEQAAAANQRAAEAALALGARVSFDGNYREQLWAASKGDAPTILRRLLATAELAFIDDRDVALIVGRKSSAADPRQGRRAAAAAAFAMFPKLERICSTIRTARSVQDQDYTGLMFTRAGELASRTHSLSGIVDRIGAGDAFTAGVLHGLVTGQDDERTLELATAAAVLKHSLRGDFALFTLEDTQKLVDEPRLDIRR